MQLSIKTLTGLTFLMDINSSSKVTAEYIKLQLAKQIGFPPSKISLVFRGQEITNPEMERKPLLKVFPDFSHKDVFVLVYKKMKNKRAAEFESSSSKAKKMKDAGSSSSQSGKASSSSGDSKRSGQLAHLQEMRDILRKFGERRARTQTRSVEPNPDHLEQLSTMGFKREAATRALLLNRNNLEMSLNWLLENSSDPEINRPISASERHRLNQAASRSSIPEALNDFIEINFGRGSAPTTLRQTEESEATETSNATRSSNADAEESVIE
mmetsp:Transcript_34984/g.84598  ORF Transcript_34984/g.84598 Transcript_34984/m.84598 type:complete len:269 (-) Transcript_34984:270-1076(-)